VDPLAVAGGDAGLEVGFEPKARYGPYYEWSRRQEGRLVHRIIPAALAKPGQQALENQRQIQALLVQWEQETVK
jgi:hypothetical protein